MKKSLIIHTAFIGDIILATPMIAAIKHEYPHCLIDFITIPASANLLEKDPNINRLIIFDKRGEHSGIKGLKKIIELIKYENYDVCLCPHRSWRSAIITRGSNAKVKVGFDTSSWRKVFDVVVKYDQNLHETQRNLSLLKAIHIHSENTRPQIFEDKNDEKVVTEKLRESNPGNEQIVAIAPGSVWATKRWPKEHYIQLINILSENNYKSILIGGVKDSQLCAEIKSECPNSISFTRELTLRQTKYLLTRCQAVVSNDSAPLHLGLAANIPVFSIFGPTIADFGFAPIEDNSYTIANETLHCRPCNIHGSYKCPTKSFDCMEKIDARRVANQILNVLN